MKPFRMLASVATPNRAQLTLNEHDGQFYMKLNGRQLMSSTATASELRLAELAVQDMAPEDDAPTLLMGGLGLGFTLKRLLELLGPKARIHVAELLPEVVEWNRTFLKDLNGHLLDDPRVEIFVEDVFTTLGRPPKNQYDAILLDVDNGPDAFVADRNARLYDRSGFQRIGRALKPAPRGRVLFWSAVEDPEFARRLGKAGFGVDAFDAKSHESAKRAAHTIYVGHTLSAEEAVREAAYLKQTEPQASERGGRKSGPSRNRKLST